MSLLEEVRGNKTLHRAGREIAQAGRNVWLAGLGAIAEISEVGEGSKKLFGELVERGRPVATKRREQLDTLVEKTSKTAQDLGQLAQDQAAYEGKRVLHLLNVPTRQDVRTLAKRIDALAHTLDAVSAVAVATELAGTDANDSVAEVEAPSFEGEAPAPRQRRTAKR